MIILTLCLVHETYKLIFLKVDTFNYKIVTTYNTMDTILIK